MGADHTEPLVDFPSKETVFGMNPACAPQKASSERHLRRFSRFNLFQPVFMVQTSKDGAGDNSLTTRNSVT